MANTLDSYRDLFGKRIFAHLTTLMRDGSPQVTPVWVDLDGPYIRINTARGRVKDRNLSRDPRVALSATDPDNPYSYVQIRGRVADSTEDGAERHIDELAKKYLDMDAYPFRQPGERRVIYRIRPEHIEGR